MHSFLSDTVGRDLQDLCRSVLRSDLSLCLLLLLMYL